MINNRSLRLGVPCPVNYNPADYFVQLLAIAPNKELECRATIKKICDSFAVSTLAEEVNAIASNLGSNEELANRRVITNCHRYRASWLTQLYAILWRSWLSVLKEPMLVKVRILQTTVNIRNVIASDDVMIFGSLSDGFAAHRHHLLWTNIGSRRSHEHERRALSLSDQYDIPKRFRCYQCKSSWKILGVNVQMYFSLSGLLS